MYQIYPVNTFGFYEKLGYSKARIDDFELDDTAFFKFKICLTQRPKED